MESHKPSSWSKDFVEHLRTVHFALAAVTVALIIAISANDKRLPVALTQIQQIAKFEKQWPDAKTRLYEKAYGQHSSSWYENLDVGLSSYAFRQQRISTMINVPDQKVMESRDWTFSRSPWTSEMTTLAEFRDLWDAMGGGLDIIVPLEPAVSASCAEAVYITLPNEGKQFYQSLQWKGQRPSDCKVTGLESVGLDAPAFRKSYRLELDSTNDNSLHTLG